MFDVSPRMKIPPFLLLATLAFWGWQSGLLWVGVALGGVLESSRFIRARFDLADEDFRRIWNLCIVFTLAVAAIVFTTNDEGGGGVISNPTVNNASNATVHTATTLLRWLPMTLFLFVAAQKFSERGLIPLSAISLVFKIRKRRSADSAWERPTDISYPYFIVCLFAAGFHANQGTHTYFLGLAILFAWALWPARSRRFGIFVWLAALMLAIALGYGGTRGIGLLVQASQSFDARLRFRGCSSQRPTRGKASLRWAASANSSSPRASSSGLNRSTTAPRQPICAKPLIAPIIRQTKRGRPARREMNLSSRHPKPAA